jgi:hypothetical protein
VARLAFGRFITAALERWCGGADLATLAILDEQADR